MITVYKYALGRGDVVMPRNARVLTVNAQNGEFYLWAEVDTEQETEIRHFDTYGTGWEIKNTNCRFVGTIFEGAFVWHVYEMFE